MRAILFCQTFIIATLIGGICAAAEPGLHIQHSADVRLDPPSRHVQVMDELEIETGGTIRFRLAPRLKLSRVEVDGVVVSPSGDPDGWSIPTGSQGRKRV